MAGIAMSASCNTRSCRDGEAGGELEVNNKPERLTFEQLLEGEVQVSLINEPVEEPQRESASARAMRRRFKQNPDE
jgi:hypothetical protein